MKKSRHIGAIVALATASVGVVTATLAAPAAAAARGPQPVSSWLRPVRANTASWIDINWRTSRTVCDAEVRVVARNVDVDYRGRDRSASFSRGDRLRPGRTDYVRIRVEPEFRRSGVAQLHATISYDDCSRRARTERRTFVLNLPVQRDGRPGNNGWPGNGGNNGWPGNGGHNGWPGNGGNNGNNGWPGNGGNNGWPGNGGHPTTGPTRTHPTGHPTRTWSTPPTTQPTTQPTGQPTRTWTRPTGQPTRTWSTNPTVQPTRTRGSDDPTVRPTRTWTRPTTAPATTNAPA